MCFFSETFHWIIVILLTRWQGMKYTMVWWMVSGVWRSSLRNRKPQTGKFNLKQKALNFHPGQCSLIWWHLIQLHCNTLSPQSAQVVRFSFLKPLIILLICLVTPCQLQFLFSFFSLRARRIFLIVFSIVSVSWVWFTSIYVIQTKKHDSTRTASIKQKTYLRIDTHLLYVHVWF